LGDGTKESLLSGRIEKLLLWKQEACAQAARVNVLKKIEERSAQRGSL
jgi:hypothetical protein